MVVFVLLKINIMKKNIFVIGLLAFMSMATSCDDLLTLESPDQLTSTTFWRNKEDAEKGIASAYSQLENSNSFWDFAEVKWPVEAYREDLYALGNDASNYLEWVQLNKFTYNNGNYQLFLYWRNCYRGLNYSNQVIEKVLEMTEDKIDANSKKTILGEAYFLRAYYHFKLILNWEKIIIRDKYVTNAADLIKGLSPREEAWGLIVADFERAVDMLPEARINAELGRATSHAANAYLGFSCLTLAWEQPSQKADYLLKAQTALESIKGFDLEKDFLSMFDGTNENSKESIFELQFSMTSDNNASYSIPLHFWMATQELGGWDEILPNQRLMDEFKKEGKIATTGRYDSRLYASVFFSDDYFNDGTGKVYGTDYRERFIVKDEDGNPIPGTEYDRPSMRKYLPKSISDFNLESTGLNIPLMRYSNVLLMLAEVYAQQDQQAKAIPLINRVRERADMPAMTGTTKEQVMAQIEHERILEFTLENFRFYDLRRWGKAKEALHAAGRLDFDPSKHNFYPVPLREVNANPAVSE